VARREAAEAKDRAALAEQIAAQRVVEQELIVYGEGRDRQASRRDLLKLAGTAVVGAAGAALLSARPASAADGQSILLGTAGDTQNHATSATTITADSGLSGTALTVDASGAGGNAEGLRAKAAGGFQGITAIGGATGVGVVALGGGVTAANGLFGGQGLNATASGSAQGVYGTGGSQGGYGVEGQGGGTLGGGVIGRGASSGDGVVGRGGSQGGYGVIGVSAVGAGVHGTGGSSGAGVEGQGGPSGGNGVVGSGGSSGVGGLFAGGEAPLQLHSGAVAGGPPTAGQHVLGDIWLDNGYSVWICIGSGIPGTFIPLQPGGLNQAHFVAASTQQYTLTSSDGVTWVDLDATNLKLTITPLFTCHAILSANSDLWTSTAGYNQDLAIFISGGAFGTGRVVAWKESGGFAGTFSPNAAFLETTQPLVAGTTYTIKLQWKANKNAPGATIWAGAGPIPSGSSTFSPTRLMALLIVSQ
jgi:hypothetical protein